VITFPNSKINLGLNIVSKRDDGFHNIETAFLPIPFEDCLEVERTTNHSSLTISGLPIEGALENNLCWKAYGLLNTQFNVPAIDIKLHKQIPSGAGLGGGSSDAAFTLKLLNEKFNLALTREQLFGFASQLGSDCPFFIINRPCLGSGRGEILEEVQIPELNGFSVLLVLPGIHISSGWAFQQTSPRKPQESIREIIKKPINNWKGSLVNDFEGPVFNAFPELKKLKETLYDAGALYASLTGSGSAVYGIFSALPEIQLPLSYVVKSFPLFSVKS
jgi:4-diphosphocytidyl-2-C-methyl-D-erythritol kinase